MREEDPSVHPAAIERRRLAEMKARKDNVRFWAGLVLAAAGVTAVFLLKEVYLGFTVALIGTGIVPFDKAIEAFKGK